MKLNIQLFGIITGSKELNKTNGLQAKIDWTITTGSATENFSTITANVYARKYDGYTTKGQSWSGYIQVGDSTHKTNISLSSSKSIGSSYVKLATISNVQWPHNSDGTGSVTISGRVKGPSGTSIASNVSEGNQNVPLETIPRASILNSISLTNTNATYSYNKKNSGFYDVITFTSNGKTLAVVNNPTSSAGDYFGTTNFDMSQVLAASTAAGSKTITVNVNLTTYSDSSKTTQIGDISVRTQAITLGSSTGFDTSQSIANNGTATITPYFTKWNAGTVCDLTISGGTYSETFTNVSNGTTKTLNNANIFNAMGTNTSLNVTVKLTTKSASNGAILGEIQLSKTLTLPGYSINVSSSFTDLNNSVVVGGQPLSYYKPNANTMIKGLSNPRITYAVKSSTGYLYGRNITTSGAKVQTISTGDSTNVVVEPGTNMSSSYTLTASDGRKSNSKTESFTLANYFNPSISPIEITRPDGPTAPKFYVSVNGTFFNGTNLTNLSNATLLVQWSNDNNNWNTLGTVNDTDGSIAYSTTYTSGDTNFYKKPVYIKAILTDRIGNQTILINNIPPGQPVFNTYKDSAGNNYMRINGDLNVDKEVVVGQISSKNLFNKNTIVAGDITGGYTNIRLSSRQLIYLVSGTYTFSTNLNTTNFNYAIEIIASPPPIGSYSYIYDSGWQVSSSKTFTISENGYFVVSLRKSDNSNITVNDILGFNYQLEKGSQATEHFPHQNLDYQPSAIYAIASSNLTLTNANYTEIPLTEIYNIGNGFSLSNNRITCLKDGYIELEAKISFNSLTAGTKWINTSNTLLPTPMYGQNRLSFTSGRRIVKVTPGFSFTYQCLGSSGDVIRGSDDGYTFITAKYL